MIFGLESSNLFQRSVCFVYGCCTLGEEFFFFGCQIQFDNLFDTVLFVILAFAGTVTLKDLISMIVVQYFAKAVIEACIGTPLAYLACSYIKRNYA